MLFLIEYLPNEVSHIEACSPGELSICIRKKINPEKIIYSGVMKEYQDIKRAIEYGVDIVTIESYRQYELVKKIAEEEKKIVSIILRLTSGNQFGMDIDAISDVLGDAIIDKYIIVKGYHYYSGTQKNKKSEFEKDLCDLESIISTMHNQYNFFPDLVEYGPGIAVDYFREPYEDVDISTMQIASSVVSEFASKYPLTIEMGRCIAATCGRYETSVMDIKKNKDIKYVIVDGGIHHVKYYKQIMSMNKPPIKQDPIRGSKTEKYTICGSLCTTADVMVREQLLQELEIGDKLIFDRVGAYSISESASLFLSREMPSVYIEDINGNINMLREPIPTEKINCP
jgi:diaminopimelate decarboxylase